MKDEVLSVKSCMRYGMSSSLDSYPSDKIVVKHSISDLTYLEDDEEKKAHRVSIFVGADNALMENDSGDMQFIGAQGTQFYLREGYCYDIDSAIMFYEKFLEYLKEVKWR